MYFLVEKFTENFTRWTVIDNGLTQPVSQQLVSLEKKMRHHSLVRILGIQITELIVCTAPGVFSASHLSMLQLSLRKCLCCTQ